jgi:hypothetical protein
MVDAPAYPESDECAAEDNGAANEEPALFNVLAKGCPLGFERLNFSGLIARALLFCVEGGGKVDRINR